MEFVKGQEMFDWISTNQFYSGKKFSNVSTNLLLPNKETEAARIFKQLLLAIQFLHAHGVVHRDLKPHNILLTEGSTANDF